MRNKGGLLINKINLLSGRVFNKILRDYEKSDLNQAQARILFIISCHPNQISIQDLCKELSVSKSTMTSMLDRLVNKGYLNKETALNDKRMTLLSITAQAEPVIDSFKTILMSMESKFYCDFTENEIILFENFLERIYRNLEKSDD